jgi:hypothetical protein
VVEPAPLKAEIFPDPIYAKAPPAPTVPPEGVFAFTDHVLLEMLYIQNVRELAPLSVEILPDPI